MSARDRLRWDAHYRAVNTPYPAPDPILYMYTPPVPALTAQSAPSPDAPDLPLPAFLIGDDAPHEYRALDLACGRGQNGLWLAEQGYSVDLMDISREALQIAREEAARRGLRRLNFFQVDLEDAALPTEVYDLVCVFRFLLRPLIPRIQEAVRLGGRVIYSTYNVRHHVDHPHFNPDYLLRDGELAAAFAGWRVLHHDESGAVTTLVAVREA